MTERTESTPTLADETVTVPIDELILYPGNAKRHDIDLIREGLRRYGQYRPAVVQRSTGYVCVGNGMVEAARLEGWTALGVVYRDVDDAEARRLVLYDNRSQERGGYDDRALAELLVAQQDFTLDGTGYDDSYVGRLLDSLAQPEPERDPDEAPELPAEPVSALGDVWQLGPHRLVCGDSTDPQVLALLMGTERAHCVWTDPPYGVDIVGGSHALTPAERRAAGGKEIQGDSMAELEPMLRAALAATFDVSRPGAAWYVAFADKAALPYLRTLTDLGVYRHLLIWVKNSLVLSRGDYHARHEPISYGWHPGAARLSPVTDRTQDTIWAFDRPSRSESHPTMKPVALIEQALLNSTERGWLVLDPFAGSGSTLVACHLQGRVARLVELDPAYCDVICHRYQYTTGDRPIRAGEPVDFAPLMDAEPATATRRSRRAPKRKDMR